MRRKTYSNTISIQSEYVQISVSENFRTNAILSDASDVCMKQKAE